MFGYDCCFFINWPGLRHRQCRNVTIAVLRNIAKLSTAVSVLAETADNYFKLSKSGEVQGKCTA